MINRFRLPCLVVFVAGTLTASLRAEDNWPSWRGPEANGHSRESGLPVRWDAQSIVWKIALPGSGQSSPVVWGDRIFLTAALDKGAKRLVLCIDRKSGAILWQHEAWSGVPEKTHVMNGWASATCATDGERVVAFFGKGGIHCYALDGKLLWSRNLGEFAGVWGTSACPIISGDVVIQNCDATDKAFLVALDKKTGNIVWQTPRTLPERGGWSTPVIVDAGNHKEIVLNGEKAVTGYDLSTGKQLWWCKSFIGRGEPTVTPGKGIVYVLNGQPSDIYAVRLGGSGDVTKTHMAWHTPRKGGRDQPSPILVGNYLVTLDMKGTGTCYDSSTGKVLWKDRLREGDFSFTSSPIAAGGLVYFQNDAGETFVLEPGPTKKVIAQNSLATKGQLFRASLTPSNGQIFSRSDSQLYCIGAAKGK